MVDCITMEAAIDEVKTSGKSNAITSGNQKMKMKCKYFCKIVEIYFTFCFGSLIDEGVFQVIGTHLNISFAISSFLYEAIALHFN